MHIFEAPVSDEGPHNALSITITPETFNLLHNKWTSLQK